MSYIYCPLIYKREVSKLAVEKGVVHPDKRWLRPDVKFHTPERVYFSGDVFLSGQGLSTEFPAMPVWILPMLPTLGFSFLPWRKSYCTLCSWKYYFLEMSNIFSLIQIFLGDSEHSLFRFFFLFFFFFLKSNYLPVEVMMTSNSRMTYSYLHNREAKYGDRKLMVRIIIVLN